VRIDLVSTTIKEYVYSLTVDVEGVGEAILSLPILADCRVPKIEVGAREVPVSLTQSPLALRRTRKYEPLKQTKQ
jgi:hypothetical protein|tara:strand:+ start:53 stop:277 length:225 start_codon:yes stop_codon:yes gene_type:complete